jgi:hypothetical protein
MGSGCDSRRHPLSRALVIARKYKPKKLAIIQPAAHASQPGALQQGKEGGKDGESTWNEKSNGSERRFHIRFRWGVLSKPERTAPRRQKNFFSD